LNSVLIFGLNRMSCLFKKAHLNKIKLFLLTLIIYYKFKTLKNKEII